MEFSDDALLPMVFRFLVKAGYTGTAKKLQKEAQVDLSEPSLGIHKKKLSKIVEKYTEDNPETLEPIRKRKNSTASIKSNAKAAADSAKPKRKASIASQASTSKPKKRKASAQLTQAEQNGDEEEDETPRAVAKLGKRKAVEVPAESEAPAPVKKWVPNKVNQKIINSGMQRTHGPSLKRVDPRLLEEADNDPFMKNLELGSTGGVMVEMGNFGSDRLDGTRGKEFRKQKHKLKNKSFYTGELTMEDRSLPFF